MTAPFVSHIRSTASSKDFIPFSQHDRKRSAILQTLNESTYRVRIDLDAFHLTKSFVSSDNGKIKKSHVRLHVGVYGLGEYLLLASDPTNARSLLSEGLRLRYSGILTYWVKPREALENLLLSPRRRHGSAEQREPVCVESVASASVKWSQGEARSPRKRVATYFKRTT